MGKCPADKPACGFYVFITGFVTLSIINELKIVQITDQDSESIETLIFQLLLKIFLKLMISRLISRSRKTVTAGDLICHGERLKMFLLFLNVLFSVLDTDNEMSLIRSPAYSHSGILGLVAVNNHAVIFDKLPVVLQIRYEMILIDE